MSTVLSFKSIENKHDLCRGKECPKKFCDSMGIINFKKEKINSLTKQQQKSHRNSSQKNLKINMLRTKNIVKLEIILIMQGEDKGTGCLKKLLQFFIMDLIMIIITLS